MSDESSIHISDWVAGLIKELDPKLTPTSDGYSEACVMAASFVAGAREEVIAESLGYDREFVDTVGNRLRSAKIWHGEQLDAATRERWANEPIAMILDVNVAKGSMVIAKRNDDGEPLYALSPSGRREVERMLSKHQG